MECWQLKQRQSLPLEAKIIMSQNKIREFYDHYDGEVYVSFSGGKDSTVLLDLVREIYPDVPAVFVDTGLEYPEIRDFVKTIDNVIWIKPKMNFKDVLDKYGFPVVSKEVSQKIFQYKTAKSEKTKHTRWYGTDNKYKSGKIPEKWKYLVKAPFKICDKCCDVMKKRPMKKYKCFVGTMAQDSHLRKQQYLRRGCNSFEGKEQSMPMAFWLEKDVWKYIKTKKLPYSKIYDMGVDRTGCMFCMFGVHLEKGLNRFQLMQKSHPKLWDYCINKLGCGEVLDYIGVKYAQENDLFPNMVNSNDTNCR